MGIWGSITHAASSTVHGVTSAATSVAHVAESGAEGALHAVEGGAKTVAHTAAMVGTDALHGAEAVGTGVAKATTAVGSAAVSAGKAGAKFVNDHSRDIAYGLGAAALVTSFIPGVDVISPFLALGAAGLSGLNTAKDIKEGRGPLQTAFDAVGLIPGAGAGAKLLGGSSKLAKALPLVGRAVTAARVGYTSGTKVGTAIAK